MKPMLYMVMSPWNIKASPFQESLKKWRGQTNTEWRKMYFYKAGDTILGSSHIKGWSKTWSCRSWSIKPCRATREKRECHVTFYPWCNPFQISYLIYHRRHSIWDNWQKNINIFAGPPTQIWKSQKCFAQEHTINIFPTYNQYFCVLMYV